MTNTQTLGAALAIMSVLTIVTVLIDARQQRTIRGLEAEVRDANDWQAQYLKARKDQVTAAADAKRATELLLDRQNRVVELQARVVEQDTEMAGLYKLVDLLCDAAGPAVLRPRGRYTISVLDGVWKYMVLETTDMGANGRATIHLVREDDLTWSSDQATLRRAAVVDADATAVLDAIRDDELPGMWAGADLIGGQTDVDATAVLSAAIDPGVSDTTGLAVHRQCERAHERADHDRASACSAGRRCTRR